MKQSGDDAPAYPREELVEDLRYLAETLSESHPDPFSGHGGRVAFHRRLEASVRDVPESGESVESFYPRAAELAARVRDGHTSLEAPERDESESGSGFAETEDATDGVAGELAVGFRVVGDELYVDEVYEQTHDDLLGARLLAVEDVPMADLVERAGRLHGADNVFQRRVRVTLLLQEIEPLRYLLDDVIRDPACRFELADGRTVDRTVARTEATDEPVASLETTVASPETDGEPAYRFLDDDRRTALLVLPDMVSYREAAEMMVEVGHEEAADWARNAHERLVDGPVPEDLDDVVTALPSAVEVLTDLVTEMAAAGTERLVVDTRENTGGNSLLSNALKYVLHGWDGILDAGENHWSVPKDSRLYRESRDDGPVEDTENPAGFDFSSYFEHTTDSERRERLEEFLTKSETFAAELETAEHEAYYCPESVSVVTAAMTYSAGAEPAFSLSELGASVVGVPPSQAPNVPRDTLRDELPNTGLEFRTAYRHVESRPDVDGRVFRPDVELTPERFEAMGRPGDAGLRLALDD